MAEQEIEFTPAALEGLFTESEDSQAAPVKEPEQPVVTGEEEPSPGSEAGEDKVDAEADKAKEDTKSEDSKTVPLAALEAERAKFKKRIEELEANQQVKEKVKPPSVFDDEEAFNQNLDERVQTAELRATLKLSKVMLAKEIGEDGVQAVWDKFSGYMADNPNLERQFASSEHPFEYARKQVEKYDMLQKIESGDIDKELDERVQRMVDERIAKMKDEGEDDKPPASLASAAGGGVNSSTYAGPADLNSILAHD